MQEKEFKFGNRIPDAINFSAKDQFVRAPIKLLKNPNMTSEAKVILCICLSNQDGKWYSFLKTIKGYLSEGREAITKGIHELEENGYLLRLQYRDKTKKRIRGSFWAYSDTPNNFDLERNKEWLLENDMEIVQFKSHDAGNPLSGNPLSGNPLSGNPLSGNPLSGNPLSGNPPTNQMDCNQTNFESEKEKGQSLSLETSSIDSNGKETSMRTRTKHPRNETKDTPQTEQDTKPSLHPISWKSLSDQYGREQAKAVKRFMERQKENFPSYIKAEVVPSSKQVLDSLKTISQLERLDKHDFETEIKPTLEAIPSDIQSGGNWQGWARNILSLSSLRTKNGDGISKFIRIMNGLNIGKQPKANPKPQKSEYKVQNRDYSEYFAEVEKEQLKKIEERRKQRCQTN